MCKVTKKKESGLLAGSGTVSTAGLSVAPESAERLLNIIIIL